MPSTDKSFLERHRLQWRVTVFVPPAARPKIGRSHLKQSLNTPNLSVANLLKMPSVARFKEEIAEAMREVRPNDIYDQARAIRDARNKTPRAIRTATLTDRMGRETEVEIEEDDEAFYAVEIAERIEERMGEDAAAAFADVALGRATPIDEYLETFIGDHGYQPKSELEMRRTIKRLREWLVANNIPRTLQAITQEVGTAFLRHQVLSLRISHKSVAGKYASFLRTYWAWLIDHRHVPAHSAPWSAKLPKPKTTGRHTNLEPDGGKRPYKAEELKTLLNGPGGDLIDLIKIGALTGMRIEEIYRLRVRDVEGGFITIHDGKTVNAKRRVPVHKDLKAVIERLQKGKRPGDYLVDPKAPVSETTGLRSGAASKAFGRYRQSLGVDERPNGKLKSNIDFHSLRRWFIQQARDGLLKTNPGYNQFTIAEVAGHEDGLTDTLKITLGLYAGASGDAALKACVAAVKLPK